MTEATETAPPATPSTSKVDPAIADVMSLFKELTHALIENSKATRALLAIYTDGPGADGEEETGLIDQLVDLQSSIDNLDTHVVGQNLMLARQSFVDDRLLEIWKGNPQAEPPISGREPMLADRAAALVEWEERLEKEAEEEAAMQGAEALPEPQSEPEQRPAIMGNVPKQGPLMNMKKLPPPPVMK